MSLFKKLKQVIEWPTKLSATMGPQSPRATVPNRPKLRLVHPLTSEEIDAARHTPQGRAIAAQLSEIPPRSGTQPIAFNTGVIPAEPAPSAVTPTPPAPPKKPWGSLRARFKTRADLVNAKVQEIKKGNVRGVLREAFKPVAAFGLTYGLKHAGKIASTLVPGGIFIGAAIGAFVGVGTTLINMRRKGELTRENLLTRETRLKLIFSGISGAVGGALGVDAADGFEHVQRFGSFLKDTFAPVALPVPNAARVAARAASSAARAASASVAQAVTSSGAAQAVAVSTNDFMNEVRRLQEKDQIRQAREQAARMATKAKEAARRAWLARENAASDALRQANLKTEIKDKVWPSPVGGEAQPLPSADAASSTLTRGARPSLSPTTSSVPLSPGVPVAAVDTAPSVGVANTGTPVADAAHAPASGVTVSLQTPAGEVSGDPARVVALQQDLAAAATAEAKQLPDGSILTAEKGVSTDPPAKILGGDVLRPTRGYATGEDQFAHAGGGTGRDARFSPAY